MSKTERNSETLAAIATPLGEGGIGVIQVSGPHSLEIVGRLFKGKRVKDITKVPSGGLFYGTLEACSEHSESNSSGTVDEVVVNVWRAGDSPTGEDMVEVNCHGGIRAIRRTLEAILAAGAKEARWPELLDQALKKGRLDLIQKEALEAITQAKTRLCVKVLLWQYQGALSRAISTLEARVKALEEGIGAPSEETHRGLSELLAGIERLLDSSTFGLALTCPQKVTIAGVPNVGKSTLFNLLLREERAIVHPEPGTTRDYVSEYLSIRGIPFELVDSAGVRNAQGQVEREGVERARALHKQADKIILVLDNSRPLSQDERILIKELDPKKVVPVINKIDLCRGTVRRAPG
ncbi:MAG TPA: tRNA modification GTPase, partial [Candidatus Hypogeohydataceae bacterium YC38]